MERSDQLGIYFEDGANRIFDILDVGMRKEKGLRKTSYSFSLNSWMNRDAISRRRSLLLGEGYQEFVLGILNLRCLLHIQVQTSREQRSPGWSKT